MHRAVLVTLILFAGCLSQPEARSDPKAYSRMETPAFPPIVAANTSIEPAPAPSLDPARDLQLAVDGFKASRVRFHADFIVHNASLVNGSESRTAGFLVLIPATPPETSCSTPTQRLHFHWFGMPFGSLLGTPLAAGEYLVLAYATHPRILELDLGAEGIEDPQQLVAEPPSFGLEIVRAKPAQKTVSLTTQLGFQTPIVLEGPGLFFSHFTVHANAYHGQQSLSAGLETAGEECGGIRQERQETLPAGSWSVALNRTLAAGDYLWRGEFKARAAANPTADAYGFLLRWPKPA